MSLKICSFDMDASLRAVPQRPIAEAPPRCSSTCSRCSRRATCGSSSIAATCANWAAIVPVLTAIPGVWA
jgi:hypothetical protein